MDENRLRRVLRALLETEGCTEAEAETRRQKASELMLEAGVTVEDILGDDAPRMTCLVGKMDRIKWNLAKYVGPAVARLSGCICYTSNIKTKTGGRSDNKSMTFAGYQPDVDNATWLMNHLLDQGINSVCIAGLGLRSPEGKDMLAAFGATVAHRIIDLADRMDTAREQCRAQATDKALVEIDKADAVDNYLRSLGIVLREGHRSYTKTRSRDAVALGKVAGNRATFARSVSSGGRPMLTKGDNR